jgi:hypothetical protein
LYTRPPKHAQRSSRGIFLKLPLSPYRFPNGPRAGGMAHGTAHGRHDMACSVPVPARHEGQCSAWAADLAHDMARAQHSQQGAARWPARPPGRHRRGPNGSFSCCPLAQPTPHCPPATYKAEATTPTLTLNHFPPPRSRSPQLSLPLLLLLDLRSDPPPFFALSLPPALLR